LRQTRSRGQNALFTSIIIASMVFVVGLIIVAISMILIRGGPNILKSIGTREIQFAIKLSFATSLVSTALCIIVAVPVAYGLSRLNFPGKRFAAIVLDVPIALPPIVSGVALLLLFGTTSFGKTLADWGLEVVFTPLGIVLAQFFVNIPYMIKVLQSTIDDIDPRMEFVARTLGCTRLQAFVKVTLPLARNGLVAGIVITWARGLGEFGAALMLAGATRLRTETLPVSLFLNMSVGSLSVFELLGGHRFELSRHGT